MTAPAPPEPSFSRRVPVGDTHERMVCDRCEFVAYENPKLVVGAVCTFGDRILLCRRDIEPRRGYWTIPAGYFEMNETTQQGAAREVREEACVEVAIGDLLGCYSIPRIGQVLMIYRAEMQTDAHAAGDETSETMLVEYDAIPWAELAFPSVRWALQDWYELRGRTGFAPRGVPAGEVLRPLPESGPLPESRPVPEPEPLHVDGPMHRRPSDADAV